MDGWRDWGDGGRMAGGSGAPWAQGPLCCPCRWRKRVQRVAGRAPSSTCAGPRCCGARRQALRRHAEAAGGPRQGGAARPVSGGGPQYPGLPQPRGRTAPTSNALGVCPRPCPRLPRLGLPAKKRGPQDASVPSAASWGPRCPCVARRRPLPGPRPQLALHPAARLCSREDCPLLKLRRHCPMAPRSTLPAPLWGLAHPAAWLVSRLHFQGRWTQPRLPGPLLPRACLPAWSPPPGSSACETTCWLIATPDGRVGSGGALPL